MIIISFRQLCEKFDKIQSSMFAVTRAEISTSTEEIITVLYHLSNRSAIIHVCKQLCLIKSHTEFLS
jgi:hypothetical protein